MYNKKIKKLEDKISLMQTKSNKNYDEKILNIEQQIKKLLVNKYSLQIK